MFYWSILTFWKHIDFLSKVNNPIGVKIGPSFNLDELQPLHEKLNPLNEEDRLVFIDVITDQAENVYPMIQSGKGHHEMHLSPTNSDTELA